MKRQQLSSQWLGEKIRAHRLEEQRAAAAAAEERAAAAAAARGQHKADTVLLLDLLEAGYRVLAARHHPDRPGGSHEAMLNLNRVMGSIRAQLTARLEGSK